MPHNEIAVEFSSLGFHGEKNLVRELEHLENLIQFDRFEEYNLIIDQLKFQKEQLSRKMELNRRMRNVLKNSNIFWRFKKETFNQMTELVQKYNGFVDKYNKINTNITSLEEEKFYTAHELTDKNKDLLSGLGFTCKGA